MNLLRFIIIEFYQDQLKEALFCLDHKTLVSARKEESKFINLKVVGLFSNQLWLKVQGIENWTFNHEIRVLFQFFFYCHPCLCR